MSKTSEEIARAIAERMVTNLRYHLDFLHAIIHSVGCRAESRIARGDK